MFNPFKGMLAIRSRRILGPTRAQDPVAESLPHLAGVKEEKWYWPRRHRPIRC